LHRELQPRCGRPHSRVACRHGAMKAHGRAFRPRIAALERAPRPIVAGEPQRGYPSSGSSSAIAVRPSMPPKCRSLACATRPRLGRQPGSSRTRVLS
jgi:hypothetical protein